MCVCVCVCVFLEEFSILNTCSFYAVVDGIQHPQWCMERKKSLSPTLDVNYVTLFFSENVKCDFFPNLQVELTTVDDLLYMNSERVSFEQVLVEFHIKLQNHRDSR